MLLVSVVLLESVVLLVSVVLLESVVLLVSSVVSFVVGVKPKSSVGSCCPSFVRCSDVASHVDESFARSSPAPGLVGT